MADFGMKNNGGHTTGSLAKVIKQAKAALMSGKTLQDVFPAAPEISSEMDIKTASRFVEIRGLRSDNGKLLAVIKREDHTETTTTKVMLSGRRLCISVHEKKAKPSGRNHLIWLE